MGIKKYLHILGLKHSVLCIFKTLRRRMIENTFVTHTTLAQFRFEVKKMSCLNQTQKRMHYSLNRILPEETFLCRKFRHKL